MRRFLPFFLAIAILGFTAASCVAAPFYFLTKSQILKKRDIRIMVAEMHQNKIYIQALESTSMAKSGKWLLGDDAKLHPLNGSGITRTAFLNWGCGESGQGVSFSEKGGEPAAELQFTGRKSASGRLIAIGNDVERVLQWSPLSETEGTKSAKCVSFQDGFKLASILFFSSKALRKGESFFFAGFEPSGAGPTTQTGCPISYAKLLGTAGPGETCRTWITDVLDCDGMGKYALGEPYGILLLESGKEREKWLILRSRGYESEGFMAIPVLPDRNPETLEIEHLHYTGC